MVSQLCLLEGFDVIAGMPVDYMHGVLLGVVKMMLSLWLDKKHKKESFYIGNQMDQLNARLGECKPPDFISRLPRNLNDRKYWKGLSSCSTVYLPIVVFLLLALHVILIVAT